MPSKQSHQFMDKAKKTKRSACTKILRSGIARVYSVWWGWHETKLERYRSGQVALKTRFEF